MQLYAVSTNVDSDTVAVPELPESCPEADTLTSHRVHLGCGEVPARVVDEPVPIQMAGVAKELCYRSVQPSHTTSTEGYLSWNLELKTGL